MTVICAGIEELPVTDSNSKLLARMIYLVSMKGDRKAPLTSFIWRNHALLRVRFFA